MEKEPNNNKLTNKKRKNDNKGMDIDDFNEDYNIYYDGDNTHINKHLGEEGKIDKEDDLIDVEFLFSEIRETYFFGIKNFLEELLDFNEFNSSDLADIILSEKDFLGNVIKTELEEETNVESPDLYAIGTIVPFYFFDKNPSLKQIIQFVKSNAESSYKKNLIDSKKYEGLLNVLSNAYNKDEKQGRLGLLVNERVSNLPHQLVGPLLDSIRDDISNYKETNDGFPKYNFTHILYITK